MLREQVKRFLDLYHPHKLTHRERLGLVEDLMEGLRREEAPLRSLDHGFLALLKRLERADLDELRGLHDELTRTAIRAFRDSASVREVHALCTEGRDAISRRVLELVEGEMEAEGWGVPPARYAWMALGSSGRKEETLYTDQDNLLVYEPPLTDPKGRVPQGEDRSYFEVFSSKVVEYLEGVGIKRCKGGVMPIKEKWRGSLGEWRERILARGKGKSKKRGPLSVLDLIILMDLRPVGGDPTVGEELVEFTRAHLTENRTLVEEMISSAILIPLPLGLFKRFVLEKTGPHKGKINLKFGGWAPLVLVVRVMATTYGVRETNTFRRIEALKGREVFSPEFASDLSEAFYTLMRLRILRQAELMEAASPEDPNYLDPYRLPPAEQKGLKRALKTVEELQKKANEIFFGGGLWR